MLIALRSGLPAGQLHHGWSYGMYWRAVQAYTLNNRSNRQAGVYIQVFVPNSSFNIGMLRLCDTGVIPARYGNTDGELHRRQPHFGGFHRELPSQWYECCYGTQFIRMPRGPVTRTTIRAQWHPDRLASASDEASPQLFLENIPPTAEHVCKHIQQAMQCAAPSYVYHERDLVQVRLERQRSAPAVQVASQYQ